MMARRPAAPDEPRAAAAPAGAAVRQASLIATFYSERKAPQPPPHHVKLYRSLARASEDAPVPTDWRDPVHGAILRCFTPRSRDQQDTTVVQLALNAPGPTATAWDGLRDRLAGILDDGDLRGIWGYSLIYEAVVPPGVEPERMLAECRPAARRLGSVVAGRPLANAAVPGGCLWLLDVPEAGDGLETATVYVALAHDATSEQTLVERTLYGPNAALLLPDLIAHKGYHQVRGYEEMKPRLERTMAALQAATSRLLNERGRQVPTVEQLREIAGGYDRLTPVLPQLINARISLVKQTHNFDLWQERFGLNAVLAFHRRFLDSGTKELALAAESARSSLEAAGYAVAVAQVQVDRAQEGRQREL